MRSFRYLYDAVYWIFMILLAISRFLILGIYCLMSILSLHTTAHLINEHLHQFRISDLFSISIFGAMSFTLAATCWKILRRSPYEKMWAIAASVANILFILVFVLMVPSTILYLGPAWIFVVISITGIVVYLMPYRLRLSLNVYSYNRNDPDQRYKELHI